MKKESFSFVKYLTKTDVKKILKICCYEINEELPTPYSKFKDSNGEYFIIVKCKKNLLTEKEYMIKKIEKYIFKNNSQLSSYSNDNTILEFTDFMLTEFLISFSEEEYIENNRNLTNIYHKYMEEKFGTFYTTQKKKYIKQLQKEDNEQEKEKEENI